MAKTPDDKVAIRKIWLAGIGAYGRAFTEAKGAVESLSGKTSEVFDELVQKGEMLEAVGKYKASELVEKGSELVGKGKAVVPDFEIDDRIAKMRERLSGAEDKSHSRLAARVVRLEAKIDAILERLDIGEAAPSKKKAPSRKKTQTKKPKTASKKKMTTQRTPKPKAAAKAPTKTRSSAKPKTAGKTTGKTTTPKKKTAKKTPPKKKSS